MFELFEKIYLLFSLPPIYRGFFSLLISGISFPLCGVIVLKMNLLPIRYMLMHGVFLGGAISLALNISIIPVSIIVNLLLIFLMFLFTSDSNSGFGSGSSAAMILSMALASLIMHLGNVPAKDTLSLMWGSPFALSWNDILFLGILSIGLIIYIIQNFKTIMSIFFNPDVAISMGINIKFHYSIMVIIIAFFVAVAMKTLGAFLIDALLILPVLCGTIFLKNKNSSLKKYFILSSFFGFLFSSISYLISIIFDLPPAAVISVVAGIIYILLFIFNRGKKC